MSHTKAMKHYHKGNELMQAGMPKKAIRWYLKSLELKDDQFETRHNLALAYQETGQVDRAIAAFEAAVKHASDDQLAQVYFNFGNLYFHHGSLQTAITLYQRCLKVDPSVFGAYMNLGICYTKTDQLPLATKAFYDAMQIELHPDAVNGLGMCLAIQKNLKAAKQIYTQGLKDFPDHAPLASNVVSVSKMLCDWDTYEAALPTLQKLTERDLMQGKKPGENPFMLVTRSTDLAKNLELATLFSAKSYGKLSPFTHTPYNQTAIRKLKIGYLSYDFRDHVMGYHSLPLFVHSDDTHFETYAYSYGPDDGGYCIELLKKHAGHFVDLRTMSDYEAAEKIREDGIDILVDLAGYTENHRMPIMAFKPASIQVSYMGFTGTTGTTFMDYILADQVLIPSDDQKYYSESVVYLPYGYQLTCFDDLSTKPATDRSLHGLPEHGLVLSAFNRGYKISREIFATWLSLLRQLPNSVLWLPADHVGVKKRLQVTALDGGVDPSRLIIAPKVSYQAHISRQYLADLALDTPIYNGGSTTATALYAGVPVVALKGAHYPSRMSMSMLTQLGMEELIVDSLVDYEALVLKLGREPKALSHITKRLQKAVTGSTIFDTVANVRAIEQAYVAMWSRYKAGKEPGHLDIRL